MTLEQISDFGGKLWNSKWTSAVSLAMFACFTLRFWFVLPPPGEAVAVLACAAGLVSIRENHWVEKLIWTACFAALLYIEVRAIHSDRAATEAEQRAFFSEQQHSFEAISRQAAKHFGLTADSLLRSSKAEQETLREAEQSASLTRESVLNLTGGDSFPYIYPTPFYSNTLDSQLADYTLNAHNGGDYPLMGCQAMIFLVGPRDDQLMSKFVEEVGFLAPHEGRQLNKQIRVGPNTHMRFYLSSQAQGVEEDLYFRPSERKDGTQPLEYTFTVRRFVSKNPQRGDIRLGHLWIHILKRQGWTEDFRDPELNSERE